MTNNRQHVTHILHDVITEILPGLPHDQISADKHLADLGADSVDRVAIPDRPDRSCLNSFTRAIGPRHLPCRRHCRITRPFVRRSPNSTRSLSPPAGSRTRTVVTAMANSHLWKCSQNSAFGEVSGPDKTTRMSSERDRTPSFLKTLRR